MDLLKELSLRGKMVFVVIHQPSSDIYKMFDTLIIMDVGGFQIYYGNPIEAVIYFRDIINAANKTQGACPECGNINPEQIFSIGRSMEIMLGPVIGGIGTLAGPIVGAAFLTLLADGTTEIITQLGWDVPGLKQLIYGAILLLAVTLLPRGLWPVLARCLGLRK